MSLPQKHNEYSRSTSTEHPPIPACVSAIRDLTLRSQSGSSYRDVKKYDFEQVVVLGREGVHYVVLYHDGELYRVNRADVEEVDPSPFDEQAGSAYFSEPDVPAVDLGTRQLPLDQRSLADDTIELLPLDTRSPLPAVPAPPARPVAKEASLPYVRTLGEWDDDAEVHEVAEVLLPHLAARGRISLVVAPPMGGKSTIMAWMLAVVSRGDELLGHANAPLSAMWISFEESPNQVYPRFIQMKASKDLVSYVDGWKIPVAETLTAVHQIIRTSRPDIVVIDSLSRMVSRGGAIRSENDSNEWGPFYDELKATVRESKAAVVLLHHTNKNGKEPRGSNAISAGADDVVSISRMAGDETARRLRTFGRTFDASFVLKKGGADHGFSHVEKRDPSGRSIESLVERIMEALRATPGMSITALAKALGLRKATVSRVIDDLLAIGKVEPTGSGPNRGLKLAPESPSLPMSDEMGRAA